MARRWRAEIRQRRRLLVLPTQTLMKSAAWGGLFQRILDEFHRIAQIHRLDITLEKMEPQAICDIPGVHIEMNVTIGPIEYEFEGDPVRTSLGAPPDIRGKTVSHGSPPLNERKKSFIFLPLHPVISADASARMVGTGPRLALALHELIHALGLEESDAGHARDADPDLYMTGAQLDANFPPEPDGSPNHPGDRLDLLHNRRFVPPLFITARTAGLIRDNWRP